MSSKIHELDAKFVQESALNYQNQNATFILISNYAVTNFRNCHLNELN